MVRAVIALVGVVLVESDDAGVDAGLGVVLAGGRLQVVSGLVFQAPFSSCC